MWKHRVCPQQGTTRPQKKLSDHLRQSSVLLGSRLTVQHRQQQLLTRQVRSNSFMAFICSRAREVGTVKKSAKSKLGSQPASSALGVFFVIEEEHSREDSARGGVPDSGQTSDHTSNKSTNSSTHRGRKNCALRQRSNSTAGQSKLAGQRAST